MKRFGTNLGRKAKRAGDKAVDDVKGDDEPPRAQSKSTGEKAAEAGRGREFGPGCQQRRAQVGAEGRRRPLHDQPDPEEGAHGHRPDRRRGLDRREGRGADSDCRQRQRESRPPRVEPGPGGTPQEQREEFKELGAGARRSRSSTSARVSRSASHAARRRLGEVKAPGSADYVATAAEAETEREAMFSWRAPRCWSASTRRPRSPRCSPTRGRSSRRRRRAAPSCCSRSTGCPRPRLREIARGGRAPRGVRARRHEARAAHDRHPCAGRQGADGSARLERRREPAHHVRGRAGARAACGEVGGWARPCVGGPPHTH